MSDREAWSRLEDLSERKHLSWIFPAEIGKDRGGEFIDSPIASCSAEDENHAGEDPRSLSGVSDPHICLAGLDQQRDQDRQSQTIRLVLS